MVDDLELSLKLGPPAFEFLNTEELELPEMRPPGSFVLEGHGLFRVAVRR